MKFLGNYIFIGIFGLAAIVILFFLVKGCNNGQSTKTLQDSLRVERQINDTLRITAAKLSLKNDSTNHWYGHDTTLWKHRYDSMSTAYRRLQANFMATRDTVVSLHDRLENAFAANDTIGVWHLADSLNDELTKINNQFFALQISRDSLSNMQLGEIQRLQGVIAQLQAEISQFKGLLTDCTTNGAALAKTADKANKKAKRRGLLNKIGIGVAGLLAVILIVAK